MSDPVINTSFARSPSGVGLVTVVIGSDDKSLTETIARLEATQKQLETTQKQLDIAQKTIVALQEEIKETHNMCPHQCSFCDKLNYNPVCNYCKRLMCQSCTRTCYYCTKYVCEQCDACMYCGLGVCKNCIGNHNCYKNKFND